MKQLVAFTLALLLGFQLAPADAQSKRNGKAGSEVTEQLTTTPVKSPTEVIEPKPTTKAVANSKGNWVPWLSEINGIWRDNRGGDYQFYFSPQLMALDHPAYFPATIQLLAVDSVNDTITFNVRLINGSEKEPVAERVLLAPTSEQKAKFADLDLNWTRWNNASPRERARMISSLRQQFSSDRELLEIELNHWQQSTPTEDEEAAYQQEQNQLRSPNLPPSQRRILDRERSEQIQKNREVIADKQRQVAEINEASAILDEIENEMTDVEATRLAQAEQTASFMRSQVVQVTIRRVWDKTHKNFTLMAFYPSNFIGAQSSRLDFVRRLLPNEEADLKTAQPTAQ